MASTIVDTQLQDIAREVFDDSALELSDATRPADVLGWDSLAHVNFMYSVEEAFQLQFSEDEFVGFSDIGELKHMIRRKLNGA
jgi:acyl carrier protein